MPTTYAHYKFGQAVLNGLPEEYQKLIYDNKTLCDIGLHGPDVMFYSNPLNQTLTRIGNDMHDMPASNFFSMAKSVILESKDSNASLAYALGYICHHTLDSFCHPYVEKIIDVTGVPHFEVEMELDRYLLIKYGEDPFTFHPSGHVKRDIHTASVISGFYLGISPNQMRLTLSNMYYFLQLIRMPLRKFREMAFPVLEKTVLRSWLGLFMSLTPNPKCEVSNEVLERELWKAVPVAQRTIMEYIDYLEGKVNMPERFSLTFGAGEHWKELEL